MSQIFLAPGTYIQGPDSISSIGKYVSDLGNKPLILGGKTAWSVCSDAISKSFDEKGIVFHQEIFGGECCDDEIKRLTDICQGSELDVVIAIGGGKSIDTGKVIAHEINIPIIVVPTTAATDAPCSREAVIYTADGVFEKEIVLKRNPDCVLVDSKIIANAPPVFLVSGMGDALATYWEADTCLRSNKPNVLNGAFPPTLSAMALARLCYDTLLEHGVSAKISNDLKAVTPSLEAVIEANTLLSGLGFESGGCAAAHSVNNGFTVLSESSKTYHGQKVAFGTIVQLVLEGRPSKDLYEVLDFCLAVGLPVCMADLHIYSPDRETIKKVAEVATAPEETIHATWFPVTSEMVADAIWAADSIAKNYMKQKKSNEC
ncbi:MAG: glycerol dehydrogenase [Desulfobacterales bacterium]|nr:glycerol dehydrogenase [Desulfobacterales bacterium]